MNTIKETVREKYSQIARSAKENSSCCDDTCCTTDTVTDCGCGSSCCGDELATFNDDYTKLEGYVADADLKLGCGMPTQYAAIKKGDTVVDLGSGAGNDVFVARRLTGESGKVIGIDFSDDMLKLANENMTKLGITNVEFVKGDIEDMPLENDSADVVISNCVLNLVPDKNKAYQNIHRILKRGGHFAISDVVLEANLPDALKKEAELYVGCVSGAIVKEDYLNAIHESGFEDVTILSLKPLNIPNDVLLNTISVDELRKLKRKTNGVIAWSITVRGRK